MHRNLEISAFENPTKAKENMVPINTVKGNKSLGNPYSINPLQFISQSEIGNGKHGFYYHHPLGFNSHTLPSNRRLRREGQEKWRAYMLKTLCCRSFKIQTDYMIVLTRQDLSYHAKRVCHNHGTWKCRGKVPMNWMGLKLKSRRTEVGDSHQHQWDSADVPLYKSNKKGKMLKQD